MNGRISQQSAMRCSVKENNLGVPRVENGNGLGVHRGTCKEHADCLYSRQTHGMSLIVPVVYGHLSPVVFSSSVLSRTVITLGRRNLSRLSYSVHVSQRPVVTV